MYAYRWTNLAGKNVVYALAGLLLATSATAQTLAGRIESYNDSASAYLLERNGQSVEVGFLVPVYEGDKITIKKPHNLLQLALGGGHQRVRVTYRDSPYTVKRIGDVPKPKDNFWGWIKILLNGWHEDRCNLNPNRVCAPVDVSTRSQIHGTLSIPLLDDKYRPAKMVEGIQPLYLR